MMIYTVDSVLSSFLNRWASSAYLAERQAVPMADRDRWTRNRRARLGESLHAESPSSMPSQRSAPAVCCCAGSSWRG